MVKVEVEEVDEIAVGLAILPPQLTLLGGSPADELLLDPSLLVQRRFDRQTNPAVDEVISQHPDLFDGWTVADFDELYSRVSTAGSWICSTGRMFRETWLGATAVLSFLAGMARRWWLRSREEFSGPQAGRIGGNAGVAGVLAGNYLVQWCAR